MHAASEGHTLSNKKSKLFENLNDAYILIERNVFWRRVEKFCENFSWRRKLQFSLSSDTCIIITSMPSLATYRVKVERILLFMKIVSQYFERKERSATG